MSQILRCHAQSVAGRLFSTTVAVNKRNFSVGSRFTNPTYYLKITTWSHPRNTFNSIRYGALRHPKCQSSLISNLRSSPFSNVADSNNTSENEDSSFRILYERNPERNKYPRAALAATVFNTSYWTWYFVDFIPAVNASPIESMHISPAIGAAALVLGLIMNSVAILYPLMLVSKLEFSPTTKMFKVYGHDMPFIKSSSSYEGYSTKELSVDASSGDGKKIVNELNGEMGRFRGHLGASVEGRWLPILMHIQERTEVKSPNLMFQALVNPQELDKHNTKAQNTRSKKGKFPKRRR